MHHLEKRKTRTNKKKREGERGEGGGRNDCVGYENLVKWKANEHDVARTDEKER